MRRFHGTIARGKEQSEARSNRDSKRENIESSMTAEKTGVVVVAWFALFATPRVEAQGWAKLIKWEDQAVPLRANGPGVDLFQLTAEARWEKNPPGEPGRFQARIETADGRVETHALASNDEPAASPGKVTFTIPASFARNIRPEALRLRLSLIDTGVGKPASNELIATIDDFPTPESPFARDDRGPFGWGRPLDGPGARPLPKIAPDGSLYVRIVSAGEIPGFFIARTEATNAQARRFLKTYDPNARRSDEFRLDRPDQPALNLSARQAEDYVAALSRADRSGVLYRLPTRREWFYAARAGRDSKFWWGNLPTFPPGANLLGPEPGLSVDSTSPVASSEFRPNPWGLFHTFGNVAEWTRDGANFVRAGGHFRTEKGAAGSNDEVANANSTGNDPFVGARPAFDLSPRFVERAAREALGNDPALAGVSIVFDPERAALRLSGTVPNARIRKNADRRLERLWFVAAVIDELRSPSVEPGKSAYLSAPTKIERTKPLGRTIDRATLPIRWAPVLPVEGSEWWVNLFWNGGRHAHVMVETKPGSSTTIVVLIDRERVPEGIDLAVALSLGAPAAGGDDAAIVSNIVVIPANLR